MPNPFYILSLDGGYPWQHPGEGASADRAGNQHTNLETLRPDLIAATCVGGIMVLVLTIPANLPGLMPHRLVMQR